MKLKKISLGTDNINEDNANSKFKFIKDIISLESIIESSRQENLKNILKALAICHNVTPVKTDSEITFQASSPDEIAFVKYAENYGLTLYHRTENSI